MTKEQIIKEIDALIKDEEEAIDGYHKAIKKMADSPRIVDMMSSLYSDETNHLRRLGELKQRVENHEAFMHKKEVDAAFGMTCCCDVYDDGDGIVFTESEEEAK